MEIYGQEKIPQKYTIRITMAPQASFFSPYESKFADGQKRRWAGFNFGVEGSKWISPNWDLGLGYYFSQQAGNTNSYDCLRVGPNPCPQTRGKVRFMKIPISVGWYFIQEKKYSSKISFGKQIQLLFDDPYIGSPKYRSVSLGLVSDWVNYIVINQNLDFVAGLRFDHAITRVDSSKDRPHSFSKSFSIQLGMNYNL